ncbi:Mitochondrial fission protein [Tieghemiomyces parasiticus]|uniref:Mitochondrial fission protein n=1 Tax=Tieghemiomyces parasiticus TaxID=78921 RepID=A0A9W8AIK2_9FUNG|nr:Mitochondrial fission protein [Tieghemiomyces parasiticus]
MAAAHQAIPGSSHGPRSGSRGSSPEPDVPFPNLRAGPALIVTAQASTTANFTPDSAESEASRSLNARNALRAQAGVLTRNTPYHPSLFSQIFRGPGILTSRLTQSILHFASGGPLRSGGGGISSSSASGIPIPEAVEYTLRYGFEEPADPAEANAPSLFANFSAADSRDNHRHGTAHSNGPSATSTTRRGRNARIEERIPSPLPQPDSPSPPATIKSRLSRFFTRRDKRSSLPDNAGGAATTSNSRARPRRRSVMEVFDAADPKREVVRLTQQIQDLENRRRDLLEELGQLDSDLERLVSQRDILATQRTPGPAALPDRRSPLAGAPRSHLSTPQSDISSIAYRDRPAVPTLTQQLTTHGSTVTALDFDPASRHLLTGSTDTTARVWDLDSTRTLDTRNCRLKLDAHQDVVRSVQLLGSWAVTGSLDSTLLVWDLDRLQTIQHPLVESEEEESVVSDEDDDGRGFIRNLRDSFTSANAPRTIRLSLSRARSSLENVFHDGSSSPTPQPSNGSAVDHPDVLSLNDSVSSPPLPPTALTTEGVRLGSAAPVTRASDAALVHRLTGHHGAITCLQATDDRLVSGSADRTVKYWDLTTGQEIRTVPVQWSMQAGAMSFAGAERFDPRGDNLGVAGFIGDLQFYQFALATGTVDGIIRMWDLRTAQSHRSLFGHTAPIASLTFNDAYVVSGSLDRTVRLWDMRVGKAVEQLEHAQPVHGIDFDGERIAAFTASDPTLHLYNIRTFQRSSLRAHSMPLTALRFVPVDDENPAEAWATTALLCAGQDGVVNRWLL